MGCRERGSHAQGVYITQDTSSMGTVRVKQQEEEDTKIIARVVRNMEERNVGTERKSPKQSLNSAEDLSMEHPERRESSFHGLD